MWSMEGLLPLAAVGSAAGFLAGLLGIGGGAVTVPIVLWSLGRQGIEGEHGQHLAVGTSMAVMVFTTFSSAWAQQKKGAVRWEFVRRMVPGLVAGSLLGSLVSNRIPTFGLQVLFIVFCYSVAAKNLFQINPKPAADLPGGSGRAVRAAVQLGGHRRRVVVGTVYDVLPRAGAPGGGHFQRAGLADCGGGGAGLSVFRLECAGAACGRGGLLGCAVHRGAGGVHGAVRALGRESGAPPAAGGLEAGVWRVDGGDWQPDAVEIAARGLKQPAPVFM